MPSGDRRGGLWFIALLWATLALRLWGLAWDGGVAAHPDERHLVNIAGALAWPDRLDPFAVDPQFPYGHLPLYAIALAAGRRDPLWTARGLAALLDTGTVALTAALGRRLAGRRAGWLAAAFLAGMPLHVQHAHFGTVDPWLAFFATGALVGTVRLAETGKRRWALWAGIWTGLALGCKVSAALLVLPLTMACAVAEAARGRWRSLGFALAAGLFVFPLTNPFAFLRFGDFLDSLRTQAALVRGAVIVPYTLQYRGTLPYLYPIFQQAIWGMGPVLALVGFGGLFAVGARAACARCSRAGWVLLAWALPFFAFTGGLFVKFPRYLLSLTPVLAAYGAQVVVHLRRRHPFLAGGVALTALLPAWAFSWALVASYRLPHPWVAASRWIREHLPTGSRIAVEAWDHPLPLDATGYEILVLPVFDPETPEKWAAIEDVLADADALVIASQRGYGALTRWPDRFPQTVAYYRRLFSGDLGFVPVACFRRPLGLAGFGLADDPFRAAGLPVPHPRCFPEPPFFLLPPLDESFTVYDRPIVLVFLTGE